MKRFRHGNAKVVIVVVVLVLFVSGLACCGIFGAALLLPAITQARHAAQHAAAQNNMKMIGLALHNYHDVYGAFPPAYTTDENGRPMTSWRVLILPYLEQNNLYQQYDLSQPWDSPQNMLLARETPAAFVSPAHADQFNPGTTTYVAIAGPNTAINTQRPVALKDITNGISNVVAVVEDDSNPVPWTQPIDLTPQQFLNLDFDANLPLGIPTLFGDGRVQSFRESDRSQFQNMISIDGS